MSNSPYLAIEPLANYFNVSVSTVRLWIREGTIPEKSYIKVANTYRLHVKAVENALIRHKEGATAEELNAESLAIIESLDAMEFDTKAGVSHIKEDKLDEAEAELEAKVRGVPNVKEDPELDDELQAILDDNDLQDY